MRIALLRGINVGGHNKISMTTLAETFGAAGCGRVTTYIQSGNVVFVEPDPSPADIELFLEARITDATALRVAVVVRGGAQWQDVVDGNPFTDEEPSRLHVAFARRPLSAGAEEALRQGCRASEDFRIAGTHIYLYLPDGMGRAHLPQSLATLKVPVTARNWRTVLALNEMAGQ